MKKFVRLVSMVLAAVVVASSCSKDKPTGLLEFDDPAAFVKPGEQITVGFKASNNLSATTLTVTARPTGWDEPTIDAAAQTLTFTVPEESKFGDKVVRKGTFVLAGAPAGGTIASASLFVAVVDEIDLNKDGAVANSYIVSQKNTHYTFDAMHKGDLTEVVPEKIEIVWQSQVSLLQYVSFKEGKGSFFVAANDDDKLIEGNAVIGAYDGSGTLLWSWHFWVADYTPKVIEGTQIMDRNLGALGNSNVSEADIQKSYGLYYQWGRKDPFVGPAYYNAAGNTSISMFSGSNGRVYIGFKKSDAETGTMSYAVMNPLTFLTSDKDNDYDWLFSAHSNELWAARKTVNDPCPAGWRVASPTSFDALTIKADQWGEALPREKYSATLMAGSEPALFFGVGRRSYVDGALQNFYFPNAAPRSADRELIGQPWVALYWTFGTQTGNASSALYFPYGATTLETAHPMRRANAMPVRCVEDK